MFAKELESNIRGINRKISIKVTYFTADSKGKNNLLLWTLLDQSKGLICDSLDDHVAKVFDFVNMYIKLNCEEEVFLDWVIVTDLTSGVKVWRY